MYASLNHQIYVTCEVRVEIMSLGEGIITLKVLTIPSMTYACGILSRMKYCIEILNALSKSVMRLKLGRDLNCLQLGMIYTFSCYVWMEFGCDLHTILRNYLAGVGDSRNAKN